MYAHKLTTFPSPVPPCSAKHPCTFASFSAPRLSTCFRVTPLRSASRSAPAADRTHAAVRRRLYSIRRPDNACAIFTSFSRDSSGRLLVLCASQQDTHVGADQVQYQQAYCTAIGKSPVIPTFYCFLQVVAVTCGAMVLAAIHRVTFSVLAVPFAVSFSFLAQIESVTLQLCDNLKLQCTMLPQFIAVLHLCRQSST